MSRWPNSFLFMMLLGGCATPVPPSGGPVDRTPPDLVAMDPPSNSVDFDGDRIVFEFSERVDQPSFQRALTIVPEPATPPELDWSGRRVEVIFPDALPDATTFVFTIDNTLRDEHGVALREPIIRAIATGSTIDSGVIKGKVLNPQSGRPVPNIGVVAVGIDTAGRSLPEAAAYRTQTGPDGTFLFRFLPDTPFFVYAFEDRNRSRSIDAGERFAVPPRQQFAPALSDSLVPSMDWWAVNPDTTAPSIVGIRAQSSTRIELRYSEPVRLDTLNPSGWAVRDTVTGAVTNASGVYRSPADERRIILRTDSLPTSSYRMARFATVRDSTGNTALQSAPRFEVDATADTMVLRLRRFVPETPDERNGLMAHESPGVQFNQYPGQDILTRIVAVADTAGVPRRFEATSDDGVTWHLGLAPPLRPGEPVRVEIDARATGVDTARAAEFRRLAPDETGAFTGFVESVDPVVVEIYSEDDDGLRLERVRRTEGGYAVDGLEVGTYRLRMFADRDADGEWDWGRLDPYERPEPLMWYPDSARVRAGWETVLDTLRFGLSTDG